MIILDSESWQKTESKEYKFELYTYFTFSFYALAAHDEWGAFTVNSRDVDVYKVLCECNLHRNGNQIVASMIAQSGYAWHGRLCHNFKKKSWKVFVYSTLLEIETACSCNGNMTREFYLESSFTRVCLIVCKMNNRSFLSFPAGRICLLKSSQCKTAVMLHTVSLLCCICIYSWSSPSHRHRSGLRDVMLADAGIKTIAWNQFCLEDLVAVPSFCNGCRETKCKWTLLSVQNEPISFWLD